MDPAFYYPDICSQQQLGTRIIALKIHNLFAVKYKVLPHLFAVMNCNRCLATECLSLMN